MTAVTKLRPDAPASTPPAPAVPHVLLAINTIMEALSKEGIAKDRKNTQQNYNFRGIDDVYNVLCGLLAEHKLIISPKCLSRSRETFATAKGATAFSVTVEAEYEFCSAVDGSTKTVGPFFGEAMDFGDKATNKAMSAAYKYMAMQEFCIPTEGDNDADATTHELAPVKPQAPRQNAPAQAQTTTRGAQTPAPPTLAQRADRLEAAMRRQQNADDLKAVYAKGSALCADLSVKDQPRLNELEDIYASLLRAFEPPADDFGIGDDEIPF